MDIQGTKAPHLTISTFCTILQKGRNFSKYLTCSGRFVLGNLGFKGRPDDNFRNFVRGHPFDGVIEHHLLEFFHFDAFCAAFACIRM
jgi:hypothetical protein